MDIEKLKATLNCIKDSETILNGEYYVVHSDFIFALEEAINNIKNTDIIIKVENIEEVKSKIEKLNDIIEEIKRIIKWSHEEHEFQGAIHSIEELIKKSN